MGYDQRSTYVDDVRYKQGIRHLSDYKDAEKLIERIREAVANPSVASIATDEVKALLLLTKRARDGLVGLKEIVEDYEYMQRAQKNLAGCIQGACNRASIPCVLPPEVWGLTPEDCAIVREQEPRLLPPKVERLDDREQIYVYEVMKARKVSPPREARYHGLQVWLYELLEAVHDSRGDLIPAGTKFYLTSCGYDTERGVRCTIAAFFEGKPCT